MTRNPHHGELTSVQQLREHVCGEEAVNCRHAERCARQVVGADAICFAREATERDYEPDDRRGRCYELAGGWIIDHAMYLTDVEAASAVRLVHGRIHNPTDGGNFTAVDHAWIEVEGSRVWEPVLNRWYGLDVFEELFKVERYDSYSYMEARELLLATKHYGPWSFEEREEVAGGTDEPTT